MGSATSAASMFPATYSAWSGPQRLAAEALEDSQVLMFRRSQVEHLITSDLNAAHQMLGIFISKQMFRLGRQSALQRVAAFLVEMEGRLGRRGSLELPMSRRDIGDYLGLP
jgi:CRP/FNR family nitrogen fixation transcriptional regulator